MQNNQAKIQLQTFACCLTARMKNRHFLDARTCVKPQRHMLSFSVAPTSLISSQTVPPAHYE